MLPEEGVWAMHDRHPGPLLKAWVSHTDHEVRETNSKLAGLLALEAEIRVAQHSLLATAFA